MKKIELKIKKGSKEFGVYAVSVVKRPAMEEMFVKLSEDIKISFSEEEDEMIITGPALIPYKEIYRSEESMDGEEAMVYFSEETIKDISENYLMGCMNNNVTLEHKDNTNSIMLIESWVIKNPKIDKSYELGMEFPKGTWMLSYRVTDKELWKSIKSNKFNGFSIEGNFVKKITANMSKNDNEFDSLIDEILEDRFINN